MIAILLMGLLACASAAPRWHHFSAPSSFNGSWDEGLSDALKQNVAQVERLMSGYSEYFTKTSCMAIEGNEYEITIPLRGYEEKEILVKAKKGMLMIQAISSKKPKSYTNARGLPECVRAEGNWSYENGELKIVLPVTQNRDSGDKNAEEAVTLESVTPVAHRSREETENSVYDSNQNADIDLVKGSDLGKKKEIQTRDSERRSHDVPTQST